MWRKAVLRWKMTTDHPAEKLGTKVMNSLDWTVQAFVDARISTEALLQPDAVESILKVWDAKARWIQEDESKLLLRKALFSVERGKDESLRQYTTRRLAQIEAASEAALVTMPTTTRGTVLKEGARLTKQSEQNLNTLLNGSTELDDVARALNMLDVESQEGIIKAAVKPPSRKLEHSLRVSHVKKRQTNRTTSQMKKKNFVLLWKKRWPHRLEKRISARQRQLTLDSGQCCRTSVDWMSCMCQMGAKVGQCWSLWCTSSLQDDDPKRG